MRKELNIQLYKEMYLIRRSEEKICQIYSEDQMKTPMHMSMGSEAIDVGICHALKNNDQVFGTYRSHALYLAKTNNLYNFFAEMYGKDTALLKGKGGSMHLCDPRRGFMGTSAIVASALSVAVGAAFANKYKGNRKVVAVFFGDWALDEGAFWESVNVASLMKLPIIFVCQDNSVAVHTHKYERQGYKDITQIVSKFRCNLFKDNTTNVEDIFNMASKAISIIRSTQTPCFIYLRYYRYLEHVGINKDFDAGYRSESEFKKWFRKDPVILQRRKLINLGLSVTEINNIEREISIMIEAVIEKVKADPFAEKKELYTEVFG